MKQIVKLSTLLVLLFLSLELNAACTVLNSKNQVVSGLSDQLFRIFKESEQCPASVQELKSKMLIAGLDTQKYMVANRGINNPALGSFSFFEKVKDGDFFFGHFTDLDNGVVILDQASAKGKLLIELIVWDDSKEYYNFYELIGNGTSGQWFYRGDSADILADNAKLYLNKGAPQFGSRLRCSACHASGGPIMKELTPPHNDWWTKARPIQFGANQLSKEVENWVNGLDDASNLSLSVKAGMQKLENSANFQNLKKQKTLQQQLRPLFCETEINLESDVLALAEPINEVQIPLSSLASPFLGQGSFEIKKFDYRKLLSDFKMKFPENMANDADHGWLVPVKGHSDILAINQLVKNEIVSKEFVYDVLAVDFQNSLFSDKRCKLVQLVKTNNIEDFTEQLRNSNLSGAKELLFNLESPIRTKEFHVARTEKFLSELKTSLNFEEGRKALFKNLIEKRKAVLNSEISKNPRGQILEPGFRVIFPVPGN